MSRKDYEMVATAIRNSANRAVTAHDQAMLRILSREIAGAFAADNARFDRDRFLAACGTL